MKKFIMHFSGPISKYRLDLFIEASPNIKDYVVCFTNRASFNYYKEYHNKLDFVFIDDYRVNEEISNKFELFCDPLLSTEEDYFKNLHFFYKDQNNPRYWPFETRRFIFKYLLEKNILNFCILNNNIIFNNEPTVIESFFNNIPPGYLYAPFHGEDAFSSSRKLIWNSLQSKFPEISLDAPFLRTCDGFLRGHHFKNKEDMVLFFNIWNACVSKVLFEDNNIGNNGTIIHLEWISSHIMQFFEFNKGYKFVDYTQLERVDGQIALKYKTRPEDKLFKNALIPEWEEYGFNYADITSISNFIKNNKLQLEKYYSHHWADFEVTDTHVYTRIK